MSIKNFFGVLIFISAGVMAQDQAIGLRGGDPFGITYKKYFSDHRAIELGLGSSSRNWHYSYYRNAFGRYGRYDNHQYISHYIESLIYFQGRYLLHYNIPIQGMVGKWQWYWGAGGVLKLAQVEYRYQDDLPPFNGVERDTRTDLDLGPEAIIGMEYTFEDVPITFFGEASLMIEIVDRPSAFMFGGVGIRLHF